MKEIYLQKTDLDKEKAAITSRMELLKRWRWAENKFSYNASQENNREDKPPVN